METQGTNQEIEQLAAELKDARIAYYNLDPVMDDQTYDAKKARLQQLDPAHSEVVAVGAAPPGISVWVKVRHQIPMGSLNKVNKTNEFQTWAAGTGAVDFFVTHKIDGSSMELVYQRGKLIRCVTRGDGIIGEDVTTNIVQVPSVPPTLATPIDATIRGEIVMRKDVFHALYASDYANPRNTAAGKVRDKKGGGADCMNLEFIAYWLSINSRPDTMMGVFEWLNNNKFHTPTYFAVGPIVSVIDGYNLIKSARDSVPYEIDGIVVSVNRLDQLEGLGDLNMRPKGQIAWKFDPAMAETRAVNVKWQVGPTGRITPVLVTEPVDVGGVTITNISLHNLSIFRDLKLQPGNRVLISRRNDVIPYCERNLDIDTEIAE